MMNKTQEKFTILVVDDSHETLTLFSHLLMGQYFVKVADSGQRALEIASSDSPPDLILLDVKMPGMDGYQVCSTLKKSPRTRHIPVIFVTSNSQVVEERRGFQSGAVDFIKKPVSSSVLLVRVANQIILKNNTDFLRSKTEYLEAKLANSIKETSDCQKMAIRALTSLAETRDLETGNHIVRTQLYVRFLALHLQNNPKFSELLTTEYIDVLYHSAPLHDIGKVGIPDRILLKPGRLTEAEYEVMQTHPRLGRDVIENAERALGIDANFLKVAKEIAYCHHEKWDGSGYPQGIAGDVIPLSARLMALADVYDALTSRRIYKDPIKHEKAVEMILEGRGKHFDPDVVDAFYQIRLLFKKTAIRYLDSHEELFSLAARVSSF
ncbi:two-component system response regulator [Pseudomonas caspiana]